VRGAPPSLTLESCFADSRQDYIVKLIEDAEAAQLRYQSPKQFRPDRDEQRYHKPDCDSHDCAGSYSARKHLLFAGHHFNLPKPGEILPHSWVNYDNTAQPNLRKSVNCLIALM